MRQILNALKDKSADFQWIVRLLAYHGARSREICQLKCEDVTTLHGVPVLRIHDRHPGCSVKNAYSVRDIPIHPMCKGIIAYRVKVAKAYGANSWLFTSLTGAKQGRGHNWQNYANRKFLRCKLGITDSSFTMHCLRHTWITRARALNMPRAIEYAITGHSLGSDEHAKYGEPPPIKYQAKWMPNVDPLAG